MKKIKNLLTIFLWLSYKKLQLTKYYLKTFSKNSSKEKYCVLKVDGRVMHGGLVDRLKSAVLVYAICKANNIPFKIYFSSPFKLQDILLPNEYDWIISKKDLTSNIFDTKIITSYTGKLKLKFNYKTQIHVYNFGGGYIDHINSQFNTDYTFASLFKELFQPSDKLSLLIDDIKKKIGGSYISVCYRFQSLLGDFYEGKHFENKLLSFSNIEREKLINLSIAALMNIKENHPNMQILVTSDSSTFTSLVSKIPNIITIPGKTVHMDYTSNEEENTYLKSYLDLYMLSGGDKIYRVSGKGLYESGFPNVAALMSNTEIEFIEL
jgi:hypothetical protein